MRLLRLFVLFLSCFLPTFFLFSSSFLPLIVGDSSFLFPCFFFNGGVEFSNLKLKPKPKGDGFPCWRGIGIDISMLYTFQQTQRSDRQLLAAYGTRAAKALASALWGHKCYACADKSALYERALRKDNLFLEARQTLNPCGNRRAAALQPCNNLAITLQRRAAYSL